MKLYREGRIFTRGSQSAFSAANTAALFALRLRAQSSGRSEDGIAAIGRRVDGIYNKVLTNELHHSATNEVVKYMWARTSKRQRDAIRFERVVKICKASYDGTINEVNMDEINDNVANEVFGRFGRIKKGLVTSSAGRLGGCGERLLIRGDSAIRASE